MTFYIRNMVCLRCIMVVKEELAKLGLTQTVVRLGEVNVYEEISDTQQDLFRAGILKYDLELIDGKKKLLLEKIKHVITEYVYETENPLLVNFSEFLSKKLNYDYTYLSNLFSEVQGISIEKYTITLKIEHVKELLVYDELNLTEIAYKLNYSSVSHLSAQFKKVTGLTPTHFKQLKEKRLVLV
jgi:AraC-like DNA-binding protein